MIVYLLCIFIIYKVKDRIETLYELIYLIPIIHFIKFTKLYHENRPRRFEEWAKRAPNSSHWLHQQFFVENSTKLIRSFLNETSLSLVLKQKEADWEVRDEWVEVEQGWLESQSKSTNKSRAKRELRQNKRRRSKGKSRRGSRIWLASQLVGGRMLVRLRSFIMAYDQRTKNTGHAA